MKKIMFMVNSLYGGGAERILQTIISHLDYNKYDVTLYSMHKEDVEHEMYKGDFHYKYVFEDGNHFLRKVKGWIFNHCPTSLFYSLYIREKYDVEVAFIEGESTKIIAGSTNKKSKKLAWVHVDLIQNPWTEFLYKSTRDESKHYNKFNKILCVSEAVRTAFIDKFQIAEVKVGVQYNPVNRENIINKSLEKVELPSKKDVRMIAVGRLVEQKGFDRLLRVVNRLKADGFDFEVYILGEGSERAALEKYIEENYLENYVKLIGFKENPYPYMAASDFMVCSSRAEGFSTVATEGIVLGLPIITTNCAGMEELFGEEHCGIITDNDEEALYQAIHQILIEPKIVEVFRRDARKRGDFFLLEKSMKEIEALLDE